MVGCSAVNCRNSSGKGLRLFRFPQDPERQKKWAINCRRDKWEPTLYLKGTAKMPFLMKNVTNPMIVDITGYTPYHEQRLDRARRTGDVGVLKREAAMKEYWVRERTKQEIMGYVKNHNSDLLRSHWECGADKKGLYSLVKWESDKIREKRKEQLLERKERLKKLIEDDNNKFNNEEKFVKPSVEDKKAEMLQRYTDIMVNKEMERRKTAKTQIELKLRRNCDELRTIISNKICKVTTQEGKVLNESKIRAERKEKLFEEKMFEESWLKDAEAKDLKNAEEVALRKQRNMEFHRDLIDQMEGAKPNADLYDENQLLLEQKRLMEVEKEWEKSQKIMNQERVKKQLDKCLKDKLKRKAKEVQEDLMLDLYFLERLIDADAEKKMAKEKQQKLYKEETAYLNYLNEEIDKESKYEKELEKMQQEANEQMWERREKEWEADRQRREAMNRKAIQECHEQIRNKIEKCRQVQEMRKEYAEEIKKQSEIDQKELEEETRKIREKNVKHQKELVQQILERKEDVKRQKEEKQKEWEKLKKMEDEYDQKVIEMSTNVYLDNFHPERIQALKFLKSD